MKYTLKNLTPEDSLERLRGLWKQYPECRGIIELQARCLKNAIYAREHTKNGTFEDSVKEALC